jgi:hypothetical protein
MTYPLVLRDRAQPVKIWYASNKKFRFLEDSHSEPSFSYDDTASRRPRTRETLHQTIQP